MSILAEVPEGGDLHLRDWLGGQTRPGQCPRPAKRFVASRSPWKLGGAIVAHVYCHRRCLSLAPAVLGQQRKCCRNLWKTRGVRTCRRFLRVVEARRCGSQPLCNSTAASPPEAVMLPLPALKHPPATPSGLPIKRPFRPQRASRGRQSKQLFWRRTSRIGSLANRRLPTKRSRWAAREGPPPTRLQEI